MCIRDRLFPDQTLASTPYAITRPPGGPRRPSGGTVLEKRPSPVSARRHHLHRDITSGGHGDPRHPRTDTLGHYGLILAIAWPFLPTAPGAPIPKNEFLVTFSVHIVRLLSVVTEDHRSARQCYSTALYGRWIYQKRSSSSAAYRTEMSYSPQFSG